MSYVHLQVHSQYSISDSLVRLPQLVDAAKTGGMQSLALTDDSNLYAAVKFYKACTEVGIKPIIGADVRVSVSQVDDNQGRLTVLCRNNAGYHFLCGLLTRAYLKRQIQSTISVEYKELLHGANDLIALCGANDSHLGQLIQSEQLGKAHDLLCQYREAFTDNNFYMELARVSRPGNEVREDGILALASKETLPIVATNRVRFLHEREFDAHEIRVCIHDGDTLDNAKRLRRFAPQQWLKPALEMKTLFSDLPEALENSIEIAKRCNVFFNLGQTHMPTFRGAAGKNIGRQLEEDAVKGLMTRLYDADSGIDGQVSVVDPTYQNRLNSEIGTIIDMGFADYFLVVAEFIRWARDRDIPVGPGRGSGAGSLVAWALGITEIDPIRYGLLFERFLNPERVSLPDFDIDFCMNRRDDVIEFVSERYGRERVAQIITFNSLAARAVVRDVGRVMGHSYGYCDVLAKMVPFEVGMTLDKALAQSQEFAQRYKTEAEVTQLIDNARLLEGLVRNPGKHAGGLVIAPRPLTDYTALYWEPGMAQPVTQLDKDDLEALGLVKFDFLGLRTLTVIDWAVKTINVRRTNSGGLLDIEDIPLDDASTFDLIRSGRATGLFQLESRGMQDLIRRLQPGSFEDLIALVALFRPGPLQSGMVDDFINRKQGRQAVRYPHPDLEAILKSTYGVILYQEQVMRIAQELAGYTLGAADLLRRAMGKKMPEEMEKQREVFLSGAVERGVNLRSARHIFDLMEHFAGYGFNKSHSAAYALLSYRTAYLKTHYPAEFMAASLSADMDHTDKVQILVSESVKQGLVVRPPHINSSNYHFSVPAADEVLYGLGAIKGVGEKAIEFIINERSERGPFHDLYDFCSRVQSHKVNNRACEALIGSGAMDSMGQDRGQLDAALQEAQSAAEQVHENSRLGQDDMFGLETHRTQIAETANKVRWSSIHRMEREYQSLGLYLTAHPVDEYKSDLKQLTDGAIGTITARPERSVIVAGLPVATRQFRTRHGAQGAFVTLADRSGQIDVILDAELLQSSRHMLDRGVLLVIEGVTLLDDRTGDLQIKGTIVNPITEVRSERLSKLSVCITKHSEPGKFVRVLHDLLERHLGGKTQVSIEYVNSHGDRVAIDLDSNWRVRVSNDLLESLYDVMPEHSIGLVYDKKSIRRGTSF